MELALRTGWTPEVIGSLPAAFRNACHWRLWVGAIVGPEGMPPVTAPEAGASPAVVRAWADATNQQKALRAVIYPEGD